jgi:hypothetical protein
MLCCVVSQFENFSMDFAVARPRFESQNLQIENLARGTEKMRKNF